MRAFILSRDVARQLINGNNASKVQSSNPIPRGNLIHYLKHFTTNSNTVTNSTSRITSKKVAVISFIGFSFTNVAVCKGAKSSEYLQRREYSSKDRTMLSYENRIRMLSTPDKLFKYFASVEKDGHLYMTPSDFVHSIAPYDINAFKDGLAKNPEITPSFLKALDADHDGLISFDEYIFLLIILSIPRRDFKIAMTMFDLDGNGRIDRHEFVTAMKIMREHLFPQTMFRQNNIYEEKNLKEFFNENESMDFTRFNNFLLTFQKEIVELEFNCWDINDQGYISSHEFGQMVIGNCQPSQYNKYRSMVDDIPPYGKITVQDFQDFYELLNNLDSIEIAVTSFRRLDGSFTKPDLKRAAKGVADINLSDLVVNVLFFLFDADRNGSLSKDEFISVMRKRSHRGIAASTGSSGLLKTSECMKRCMMESMQ